MDFLSLASQIRKFMYRWKSEWKLLSLITQIISLVSSMDLDLQQKSESELISLIKQIVSLFNSKPDSEVELVSLITQTMSLGISVESTQESELLSLISQLVSLKPEPQLTSLIKHIISRFKSMNWEPLTLQLVSLSPQFRATSGDVQPKETEKRKCRPLSKIYWRSARKNYFHCCNGEDHEEEYEKALLEVKHPLHPKHSLQLVSEDTTTEMRKCYCCGKSIHLIFYYCQACDYAMDLACVDNPQLLSTDHPKWHEHTLALFPSQASFPCNLCALTHSNCPFYICPPCDFVVHQSCLSLPRVIRISRHLHRIYITHSFNKEDRSCNVCRKKIDNDYGGYSCIKDNCSYAAHSKCATRSNVWDGIDLEGVPEEIEEELEPFVRIREGIIQHFGHQQHHLRLDENTSQDYDENKLCQACVTPIYFGKFYSCMECEFLLHEICANLPRRMYHPVHQHRLILTDNSRVVNLFRRCSGCVRSCTGFFYKCDKDECRLFKLHVQCAIISEPLVHESHTHPLYLTSKPGERTTCGVCKTSTNHFLKETFNCIECEFSLCFGCATIPHRVRYKHDKHTLTLSYGEESSTMMYWCEACEGKINPKERFYKCDEYCCVTIHIECLIGEDFDLRPGSSLGSYDGDSREIKVLTNNHRISRPICCECKKRCPQKIVCKGPGLIFCSHMCVQGFLMDK